MSEHCVYLTVYSGDILPPFYIGSSYVESVLSGYHGTVKSKKYRTIWREEIRSKPHLFQTIIISRHETQQDAREQEYQLQKFFDVVRNPLFINLAYANLKFGASGKDHYLFNKELPAATKAKISLAKKGKKMPDYAVEAMRIRNSGSGNSMFGKQHSDESNEKNRNSHLGKKWWNNGIKTVQSHVSPGENWKRGRL
jgi:hypothetical protein